MNFPWEFLVYLVVFFLLSFLFVYKTGKMVSMAHALIITLLCAILNVVISTSMN